MTRPEVRELLERARTELAAGRSLAEGRFAAQAVMHAYYAAFFAAEAALLALGETRSKHSGVISAFGQLVVKTGSVDAETGSKLRKLFELRNTATYDAAKVEADLALSAIADAERFAAAVEAWLHRRQGSA
ncbi:MAG: HEPN domain-containing protein [Candidatus Limnocylindria bacterium]